MSANQIWSESSTFRRLLISQHVRDLQAIFYATLFLLFVAFGLIICIHVGWIKTGDNDADLDIAKSVGAILLIGGTILAWLYQTGSKRLGIVDLFGCEIATVCRVGTITGFVPYLVEAYEKTLESEQASVHVTSTPSFTRFTSEEQYFSVFEHNSSDLEVLEADVVANVTAFYTYMKTVRDYLRYLGDAVASNGSKEQRANIIVRTIYMTFLAYESARKAIDDLIEYYPMQAEANITGLISELQAFDFLIRHFQVTDMRGKRLSLREENYSKLVPKLYQTTMGKRGSDWFNAQTTATDLEPIYNTLGFESKILPIEPENLAQAPWKRRANPPAATVNRAA